MEYEYLVYFIYSLNDYLIKQNLLIFSKKNIDKNTKNNSFSS